MLAECFNPSSAGSRWCVEMESRHSMANKKRTAGSSTGLVARNGGIASSRMRSRHGTRSRSRVWLFLSGALLAETEVAPYPEMVRQAGPVCAPACGTSCARSECCVGSGPACARCDQSTSPVPLPTPLPSRTQILSCEDDRNSARIARTAPDPLHLRPPNALLSASCTLCGTHVCGIF